MAGGSSEVRAVLAAVLAGGLLAFALPGRAEPAAPDAGPTPPPPAEQPAEPAVDSATDFAVPPPPFSEGIFPCTGCHADLPVNLRRRALKNEHTEIELHHGPRERWCFDCHDPANRDQLRLASGAAVPFTASYRLCGQCHGDKFRDWKVGVHGKRTGEWNGKRSYLLCAHCHNPHSPHFAPLKPLPPPVAPAQIR